MSFYPELDNLTLCELRACFKGPPLEGEEYADVYYSEVALLIRQEGKAGIKFLWREASPSTSSRYHLADSARWRAILLALSEPDVSRLGTPEWLLSYLEDERPLIVAEAIDSLSRQQARKRPKDQKDVLNQVLPLLKKPSPYIKGSVLRFMSENYPTQAVPLLIEALKEPHFIVRENAADELGELEVVDALPYLYPLLEAPHPHVRQAAETAIEMLEAMSEANDALPLEEADEIWLFRNLFSKWYLCP